MADHPLTWLDVHTSLPPTRLAMGPGSEAPGLLAAGGTLGILIPPSINMIIYGAMTNTSVGKLYAAGVIPGLLLTACFMIFIAVHALVTGTAIQEEKVPLAERIRLLAKLREFRSFLETTLFAAALEEIAAVPGIDALFVGPADLSAAVGPPGQFTHPAVVALMAAAAAPARAQPAFSLGVSVLAV